jgi:hypothetical protein
MQWFSKRLPVGRHRGVRVAGALAIVLSGLTLGHVGAQMLDSGEVDNVELPIQSYPSGRKKTVLKADKAIIPPTGLIEGSNVVVEMYTEKGGLEGVLKAEKVLYNRKHQRAVCVGPASLQRKFITIKGDRVAWAGDYNRIIIESNAYVRFLRTPEVFKGVKP